MYNGRRNSVGPCEKRIVTGFDCSAMYIPTPENLTVHHTLICVSILELNLISSSLHKITEPRAPKTTKPDNVII